MPPPPARRSATRPCVSSATTTGTPPQLEALPGRGSGPRPRAGRRRHRDPGVQRDLGEDDGRPRFRRRPRDDVHRRLRARRRRPGARPPVRGGVRLPRRRGRMRARRRALHVLRPGDVVFAGVGSVHGFYNTGTERVRWIETQAPQPPARHAYRWVAELGAVRGAADMRSPDGDRMQSSSSAGPRAIGQEIARHYAGPRARPSC